MEEKDLRLEAASFWWELQGGSFGLRLRSPGAQHRSRRSTARLSWEGGFGPCEEKPAGHSAKRLETGTPPQKK